MIVFADVCLVVKITRSPDVVCKRSERPCEYILFSYINSHDMDSGGKL